jgi:AcrR family transcriptional regulator
MSRKNGQEEKRIQILQALDQCLQEKPFDQTSIKDIAKTAGVNHGLLHYYFKGKEDILINYIDYIIEHYLSMFEGWYSEKSLEGVDEKKLMKEFFEFMNERITLNQSLSKVFIEIWEIAAYNPKVKSKLQRAYTQWTDVLTGILKRTIKNKKTARQISMAVVAFHEGVSLLSILMESKDVDLKKVLAVFQKTIIDML